MILTRRHVLAPTLADVCVALCAAYSGESPESDDQRLRKVERQVANNLYEYTAVGGTTRLTRLTDC